MSYQGSTLLLPIAEFFSLQIDQFNFITTQAVGVLAGLYYRTYLGPCKQNIARRLWYNAVLGIVFGFFCFGHQMLHLVLESIMCYLLLLYCPRKYVHLVTFVFSMSYLSLMNIYDVIYNYGIKTLDITVLMMLSTQKFTSLAFSFYDGMKDQQNLSADQQSQSVITIPSVAEYVSFVYNYQGILVGPISYYRDYMDFITGNNILKHKKSVPSEKTATNGHANDKNHCDDDRIIIEQPSITKVFIKKAITIGIVSILFLKVTNVYPVERNLEIANEPIWYRILYAYISIPGHRIKYYLAWVLGDLVSNVSGLGFNGYDAKSGEPLWDLVTNVKIIEFETSTSIKAYIDAWNIQTRIWLRRIAFDRLPAGKTLGVFVLSAFWHGFYPGYYLMFVLLAFLVYAGRGIRRKIRPLFVDNNLQFLYSIITWIVASLALNYAVFSFIILDFWSSIKFYNSWYWLVHILGIGIPFILPGGSVKKSVNRRVDPVHDFNDVPIVVNKSSASPESNGKRTIGDYNQQKQQVKED